MTTASPTAPATPIFDEVDRWWRDGGDEAGPGTMLTFAGSVSDPPRTTTGTATSGPRHGLVRPPAPPA
jgi:hypothetical protein